MPKGVEPATLTLERAIELIRARVERGGMKGARPKKAAKKTAKAKKPTKAEAKPTKAPKETA